MDKRQQIIGEWIQLIPRTYFNWQGDCIIYADIRIRTPDFPLIHPKR